MKADHQRDCDGDVLPEGVSVHASADAREAVAGRWIAAIRPPRWEKTQRPLSVPLGRTSAIAGFWTWTSTPSGNFDADVVFADLGDAAGNAATGNDFVALGERCEHGLVFLGLLLLRTDHQEPQHHEHQDDGQELHQAAGGVGRTSSLLGVSNANQHGMSPLML